MLNDDKKGFVLLSDKGLIKFVPNDDGGFSIMLGHMYDYGEVKVSGRELEAFGRMFGRWVDGMEFANGR